MTAHVSFKDLRMWTQVIVAHDGVTLLQEADALLFRAKESSLAKSRVLMGTEPVRIGFLSVWTQTHTITHTHSDTLFHFQKKLLSEKESQQRGERFTEEVRRNL